MTELEKVVKGLESCRPGRNCDGCPYHELFMKGRCNKQMEADALAVLREQNEVIERYHSADAFLATHGWDWNAVKKGEKDDGT